MRKVEGEGRRLRLPRDAPGGINCEMGEARPVRSPHTFVFLVFLLSSLLSSPAHRHLAPAPHGFRSSCEGKGKGIEKEEGPLPLRPWSESVVTRSRLEGLVAKGLLAPRTAEMEWVVPKARRRRRSRTDMSCRSCRSTSGGSGCPRTRSSAGSSTTTVWSCNT